MTSSGAIASTLGCVPTTSPTTSSKRFCPRDGGFLALSAAGKASQLSHFRQRLTHESASLALCCYEHLITLADEVRCIWRRRVSGATILFLVNRYAILVLSLASIVNIVRWKDGPAAYVSQGKVSIHRIYRAMVSGVCRANEGVRCTFLFASVDINLCVEYDSDVPQ